METVLEHKKEFEHIVTIADPAYNDLVSGIELVKKFIIDNQLIIYGGSAIDYALRLQGDNIYPDDVLKVPDLDMYSPDNIEHSYQLADILYTAGYKESRSINALHTETMRVDILDNHFIADITYVPQSIYDKLPYLEYNGMRIIHPMYQRIDVHSSLAFPYDDVPREVIFVRWSKDVTRFNKLSEYYPVETPVAKIPTREVSVPTSIIHKHILMGFAAYAAIYTIFTSLMNELGAKVSDITVAEFSIDDVEAKYPAIDQRLEVMHFDLEKASEGVEKITHYEPYINLIPERIEGEMEFGPITIYSVRNKLVTSNSVHFGKVILRIVNIQYLLRWFLAMHYFHLSTPKLAGTYLDRYISLISMINQLEEALISKGVLESKKESTPNNESKDNSKDDVYQKVIKSPLFLTPNVYGNSNINLSREIALSRLHVDLQGGEMFKVPQNYYPDRFIPKGRPHPVFDYEGLIFFRELGREIKK